MKKIWSLALAAILLTACNNSNNTTTVTEAEPLEQTTTEEAASAVMMLQHSFENLFAYMAQQDSSFAPQNFKPGAQGKIDALPAAPIEPEQLKPFEPFLIYNSDSSKAIDLYSYNYIITRRNGQVKLEEAGPDTEIALIDVASNTRKRIFFSGPSTVVFDARWNSDNEIVMAGAEQLQNNQVKPIAWQYNLTDSVMQTFTYDEAIAANMKGYKDQTMAALTPQRGNN